MRCSMQRAPRPMFLSVSKLGVQRSDVIHGRSMVLDNLSVSKRREHEGNEQQRIMF